MDYPLFRRLPGSGADSDQILNQFLDYVAEKKLELYPAQEEAILELFSGKNVILNTPTGSGKSLVATALHFKALAENRRSVYTCPIKALVNEKFLALCKDFGPEQVGMATGDATVNRDAPIICCTAEILSNIALRDGETAPFDDIIIDEFHYYSDRERGVAWQVPLLTLRKSRFLLMSATLGDTTIFERSLTELNGRETPVVRSKDRPVPLEFTYQEVQLDKTILDLIAANKAPVYVVSFTQRECAEEAQNLLSVDFCSKDEKKLIASAIEGVEFSSPYGKEIQKFIRHGVGIHHAGLLPKYRVLVERLAQRGLLKIICGTDTLGVGVNIPIRTVLFTKLCKFDGEKTAILSVRDFQQIAGRAGRRGFDTQGYVVAQAPAHVIENLKQEQKAHAEGKKAHKLVKKKPPEKGFVPWNRDTFQRLIDSDPEQLVSRFFVSHGMILNVLSRDGDGCHAMRDLIRNCHESPNAKKRLFKTAFQLFRSLVERGIIEFVKPEGPGQSHLRLNIDLQEDFSLNHTLSLYLLDTIKLLDPDSLDYALDLLTLVEAILEDPEVILRKQLDRVITEKLDELKMAGVEYDERMAEIEKLEYPKPNREFIYNTFNEFSARHPWVGQENIRPKSIAREMYETFFSFSEYIRDYGLQRMEGLLLRYLSEVYKALVQTVPDHAKSDEVHAIIDYLGTLVRSIDSSLLDEWERLRNPQWVKPQGEVMAGPVSTNIVDDKKKFTVLVRNEIFRVVRATSCRDYLVASTLLDSAVGPEGLKTLMEPYFVDHQRIRTDQPARTPIHMHVQVSEDGLTWLIDQVLVDPEEHNDWVMKFSVDLDRSRKLNRPLVRLLGAAPL